MKDENKVNEFMEEQRKLAERIAKSLNTQDFQICYFEYFPSSMLDSKKKALLHPSQKQLPDSIAVMDDSLHISKQRIEVRIFIKVIEERIKNWEYSTNKLDKIMCRQYGMMGNYIIYSVKPFH